MPTCACTTCRLKTQQLYCHSRIITIGRPPHRSVWGDTGGDHTSPGSSLSPSSPPPRRRRWSPPGKARAGTAAAGLFFFARASWSSWRRRLRRCLVVVAASPARSGRLPRGSGVSPRSSSPWCSICSWLRGFAAALFGRIRLLAGQICRLLQLIRHAPSLFVSIIFPLSLIRWLIKLHRRRMDCCCGRTWSKSALFDAMVAWFLSSVAASAAARV